MGGMRVKNAYLLDCNNPNDLRIGWSSKETPNGKTFYYLPAEMQGERSPEPPSEHGDAPGYPESATWDKPPKCDYNLIRRNARIRELERRRRLEASANRAGATSIRHDLH